MVQHTCLQDDMPPNKGEESSLPHPCIYPFLVGSSNEEPAFGTDEVHTEVQQEDPFPEIQYLLGYLSKQD